MISSILFVSPVYRILYLKHRRYVGTISCVVPHGVEVSCLRGIDGKVVREGDGSRTNCVALEHTSHNRSTACVVTRFYLPRLDGRNLSAFDFSRSVMDAGKKKGETPDTEKPSDRRRRKEKQRAKQRQKREREERGRRIGSHRSSGADSRAIRYAHLNHWRTEGS